LFFALTANLYVVLCERFGIEQVRAPDDVQEPNGVPFAFVADEGNAAAVYSVIASPPFSPGASH
jgi:hypothetical protein